MILENENLLREYYAGKAKGIKGVAKKLAKRYGVSHQAIYKRLKVARSPQTLDVHAEVERIRLEELWDVRYKVLWEALPRNRTSTTVGVVKGLVCEMIGQGFSVVDIERFTKEVHSGKHRATITHHANECEF